MAHHNWNRVILSVISTMFTLGLVIATPTVGRAQQGASLSHYEDEFGNHWLIGCVADDLANRLIAHGGFDFGGGTGGVFLIGGYTAGCKQHGN